MVRLLFVNNKPDMARNKTYKIKTFSDGCQTSYTGSAYIVRVAQFIRRMQTPRWHSDQVGQRELWVCQ